MIPPEIPVPEGCPKIESIRGTVVTIKKAALQELKEEYKNYIKEGLTLSYAESTAKGCTAMDDDKKGIIKNDKEIKIENTAKEPQTINFNFSVNGDNANVRNIVNNGIYVEGGNYKDDK